MYQKGEVVEKFSLCGCGENSVEAMSIPGLELISEWFAEDKAADSERMRFEGADSGYSVYAVSSKGAL